MKASLWVIGSELYSSPGQFEHSMNIIDMTIIAIYLMGWESMFVGSENPFKQLNGQKRVDVVLNDLDQTATVELSQASLTINLSSELTHGGTVGVGVLLVVGFDVIGRHDEGGVAETDKDADIGEIKGR